MAFGKTILPEAFYLLEDRFSELRRVPLIQHTAHQAVVKMVHTALAFPGRHGASQFIRFTGGEVRGKYGNLHHLLLKYGNAQGALECGFEFFAGVLHMARVFACLQVGVHHAALNRSRPYDSHLNHQVVIGTGLQTWQHAHLGAALNLKHPDGIGAANHVVGGYIVAGNILHAHGAW